MSHPSHDLGLLFDGIDGHVGGSNLLGDASRLPSLNACATKLIQDLSLACTKIFNTSVRELYLDLDSCKLTRKKALVI